MKVAQSCLTLRDPVDYTVHGILQAKILDWVAISFSRGSSQPRDQTQVSHIAGGFFTSWASRKTQFIPINIQKYLPFPRWGRKKESFWHFSIDSRLIVNGQKLVYRNLDGRLHWSQTKSNLLSRSLQLIYGGLRPWDEREITKEGGPGKLALLRGSYIK